MTDLWSECFSDQNQSYFSICIFSGLEISIAFPYWCWPWSYFTWIIRAGMTETSQCSFEKVKSQLSTLNTSRLLAPAIVEKDCARYCFDILWCWANIFGFDIFVLSINNQFTWDVSFKISRTLFNISVWDQKEVLTFECDATESGMLQEIREVLNMVGDIRVKRKTLHHFLRIFWKRKYEETKQIED